VYLKNTITDSGSEAAEPRNIGSKGLMNAGIKVQSTVIFLLLSFLNLSVIAILRGA
jgi:hypothetical protein